MISVLSDTLNKEETMESISEMFPSVISAEEVRSFYQLVTSGPSRIREREENVNESANRGSSHALLDKLA